ncbi:triacylglycerol lipase [Dorcoceras hygrometricum]|uniref:Triacylglycerol lipase n=1 Tax=Dorcoceras hygrometricum TaxID=472368 RepID=A0A2Z7BEM6_9LAMI|nr:triacylglycerol lipase [Dorcoceras hygrometricum]
MADETDEVFDFSNLEFTREYLVTTLNDIVQEYKKLSQSFEEVKTKRESWAIKGELVGSCDMQANLSKLTTANEELRCKSQDMLYENQRLAFPCGNLESSTCVTLNGSGIQPAVGPQPLWLRNHNFGIAQRIMVKRLATSPHDPIGITDSACKNQLVMVSVQYGPFNPYIPIRSTTIGKSRVAKDPIAMHTSWRSNSDIASVTRVSMTFRVVRTNQYNQDLGLIHSKNGNHLESPNEGSSIDHQVTIYLHAQNITMFPTNETWYFASQILVSSSGGLILILTVQSTRN